MKKHQLYAVIAIIAILACFFLGCAATTGTTKNTYTAVSTYITSEPEGAEISLNGEQQGKTPLTVKVNQRYNNIMGGSNTFIFKAEKEGFRTSVKRYNGAPFQSLVYVVPGRLHFLLKPTGINTDIKPFVKQKASAASKIRLYVNATPNDSKIQILNINPVYMPGIELNPGDYHLEVSREGYITVRKWISAKLGEDLQVDIDLVQQVATKSTLIPQQKPFLPQKDLFRQHWAVIIGVSRYSDTRVQSLRYANADAKYFYNWLISATGGKYSPNNIKLLLDKEATSRNIRDALFNWLRQAIEEDIVIIYFAGHGSPDSPDTPENLYLLPYDTQYDNIASTGFPMWDVETAINRFIKAKRIIVIADACHSGGVGQAFDVARRSTRGIGVNPISTRLEQLSKAGKGVAVISASGDKQTSQEGNQWGGGHGVFTYYLMEALKGSADYNQDTKVSLGELIPYLSEQVRRETRNAQGPVVSGKFDPALSIAK